uniref:3-hydroxy-3-methylglutaryl coenzyme A reductase n=1 Tax=Parastrongyloides trichosuri TaxID=131310 RepID=A0A0N4ZR44_PARTI
MSTCYIASTENRIDEWQYTFKSSLLNILNTINHDQDGRWRIIVADKVMELMENTFKNDISFNLYNDSSADDKKSLPSSDSSSEISTSMINYEEVVNELRKGNIKTRELESKYGHDDAVIIRRKYIESITNKSLVNLPYDNYDYSIVNGACCENVIGFVPIPTGIAGPLIINGETLHIPLATTEGALIASTNRGCRAVIESGGITSFVFHDGMTRAPVVKFNSIIEAAKFKNWIEKDENFNEMKKLFESTSRFALLKSIKCDLEGRYVYIRFEASTGDAMGMNMVSKGVHKIMEHIQKFYPNMILQSLSGNQCVDKKASAINWINGRGKSVVAEAIIKSDIVKSILKTDVDSMVELSKSKLLIGTSTTMTIGGWNAHSANIVAALFLATGQDAAQVVSSSMCLTQMEKTSTGDLYISCTMKCVEVGTVGGGTILSPQKNCLNILNCQGSNIQEPSANSKRLATIICSTVLAGELSLMAAQCSDDLVRSHLRLNRSNLCLSSANHNIKKQNNNLKFKLSQDYDNSQLFTTDSLIPTAIVHLEKSTKKIDMKCSNIL